MFSKLLPIFEGFGFGKFGFGKKVLVLVSENLVSEKSLGFGKIWSQKKVSVSGSENLVSEEKHRFRFQKNLVSEKSLRLGFGKFGLGKEKIQIRLILRCWGKSSMVCQQNSDAL